MMHETDWTQMNNSLNLIQSRRTGNGRVTQEITVTADNVV